MQCLDYATFDPIQCFLTIRESGRDSFFFESSDSIETKASVSIIGIGPFEVLRNRSGVCESLVNGKLKILEKSFLEELESRVTQMTCAGPFRYAQGGIFGVIGYDIIGDIESKIRNLGYFKKQRSEASETIAEVFIARNLIVVDHKNQKISVVGGENIDLVCRSKSSPDKMNSSLDQSRLKAEIGAKLFSQKVLEIKKLIREGDIFQAVLAERFEVATQARAVDIFLELRKKSPSPYSFYFDFAESSFFGASPETLIKISERKIKSHPIAGTKKRGLNHNEDKKFKRQLTSSRKEAAEHLMLVDLARNDVGRVSAAGSVKLNFYRNIQNLSNVMHLVSEIEGQLKENVTSVGAFRACFPAGTLSGAPKIRAMQILSNLESKPRGFYGGAVVAFDSVGGLDSCIAIRALELKNKIAILRAGAGIVADSTPEREYDEIHSKLRALREAIASAEEVAQ